MYALVRGHFGMSEENNGAAVGSFLSWQRDQRRRSPNTLYTYATTLDRFLEHIGATPLGDVSVATIEDWLQRPRNGRAGGNSGSAATVAKEVTLLRTTYRFLLARGAITRDPTV